MGCGSWAVLRDKCFVSDIVGLSAWVSWCGGFVFLE